jgi:uncharacterized hydantoinase/oxoprolinase family protein
VPLVRQLTLRCALPYAFEGAVRREAASACASIGEVEHAELVHFALQVAETGAAALRVRIDHVSQRRAAWIDV